jgi:hypothetical protein
MRRLVLSLLLAGGFFIFPSFVSAQTDVTLSSVKVQLWPEYDKPSMLVIVDYYVAPGTSLPVDLTFRIPLDANLFAVAYDAGEGRLMNAMFTGPTIQGEWQEFSMSIQQYAMHRFEYYQPLKFNGQQRTFTYVWDGAYAVNEFFVTVQEPPDTVSFSMEPAHASVEQLSELMYSSSVVRLSRGEQYLLNVRYERTASDPFRPPEQELQPVTPLDESTLGRASLSNYLPYLIGGIGMFLVLGGAFYYWQAGSVPSRQTRRRNSQFESDAGRTASYCPQCGTRSKPGDRFCRTCGARLRRQEQ